MRAYKLDYFTSDLGIFFPAFPLRSLSSVTAGRLLLQFPTSETPTKGASRTAERLIKA